MIFWLFLNFPSFDNHCFFSFWVHNKMKGYCVFTHVCLSVCLFVCLWTPWKPELFIKIWRYTHISESWKWFSSGWVRSKFKITAGSQNPNAVMRIYLRSHHRISWDWFFETGHPGGNYSSNYVPARGFTAFFFIGNRPPPVFLLRETAESADRTAAVEHAVVMGAAVELYCCSRRVCNSYRWVEVRVE